MPKVSCALGLWWGMALVHKRKLGQVDPAWDWARVYSSQGQLSCKCTLMIEEHNVMQVFEFRETPEPVIIMDYYPLENMMDAGIVDEKSYVSTLGQILDRLRTLSRGLISND